MPFEKTIRASWSGRCSSRCICGCWACSPGGRGRGRASGAGGLGIGGTGYLAASVREFYFPHAAVLEVGAVSLAGVGALAEIGFAVWLLVRGRIRPKAASAGGQGHDGGT